jgi:hypothetical protein
MLPRGNLKSIDTAVVDRVVGERLGSQLRHYDGETHRHMFNLPKAWRSYPLTCSNEFLSVEIHGARLLPGQVLMTRGHGKILAPLVMAIVPVWASLFVLWE